MKELRYTIYMGVVEDISDPKRTGRIKIRVQGLFDNISLNDIPWAYPYKSLAGKSFELPSVGKLVNVIFPSNHLEEPYYIFSENYNINLENILMEHTKDDYENFLSLIFDHKTQIYSNNDNLTLDYKINKMTLSNTDINLELKDNTQKINIGTKTAKQQAILGNNFLDWFDRFMKALQNDPNMLGNGMIVTPPQPILKPTITNEIVPDYFNKRKTFISEHVNIVDNKKIKELKIETNKKDKTKRRK